MADLSFVSLYSGCGGLDLGFARAGMRPVWANDMAPWAVETYNRISKVTDPNWADAARLFEGHSAIAGDVRLAGRDLREGMADLVIGGPPCQSFSVAGRMDPDDSTAWAWGGPNDAFRRPRPAGSHPDGPRRRSTSPHAGSRAAVRGPSARGHQLLHAHPGPRRGSSTTCSRQVTTSCRRLQGVIRANWENIFGDR